MTSYNFNIWEGIYKNWEDAPFRGDGFNSKKWLKDQSIYIDIEVKKWETSSLVSRDYILPVLVALINKTTPIRVLDFGGGMASSYPLVMGSVSKNDAIEYHVIDSQIICKHAQLKFSKESNLFFHEEIPVIPSKFDIVFCGRSMQYVEDWKGLLYIFAEKKATYILLICLAGNIKSFVSIQNYYGNQIRVWFLNLDDLISELGSLGYKLIYKTLHISKRLGIEGPLPMDNFPPEYRLDHASQLLFELTNR